MCGSCSSLVTTHFAPHFFGGPLVPKELADLIISAILIDTGNLKPSPKGKAEDVDRAAMATLVPLSSFAPTQSFSRSDSILDLGAKFDKLSLQKSSVGHLSPHDLLRRDYKELSTSTGWKLGLSTVPISFNQAFIRSNGPIESHHLLPIQSWLNYCKLDAAFVLTSFTGKDGKKQRELIAFVPSIRTDLIPVIFNNLPSETIALLNLVPWSTNLGDGSITLDDGSARAKLWRQINSKSTRKQVAPALKSILDKLPKSSV